MTKPSKPCDIYVRVSRVGGRENLISPEEQETRARDLARSHDLKVGEVIADLDQSGGKWDRPGLQRALERVRAGQSGGLIVAWLDRLSRDSEHAHALVRMIGEAGGAIYAPDAPPDFTTPEGQLQAGMIFLFAQYQRARIRERWASQQERSIANGVPVGGRVAVGYRQRDDRRLEPDPATAPIVRRAFEMRVTGAGPAEIGRMLSTAGVRTSWGSPVWTDEAVRSVLRNRIYLGELAFGRPGRKGTPRYVNVESHEPIVDVALWSAAQHPRRTTPASTGANLLSGILRCAGCGYVMESQLERSVREPYRVYKCRRKFAGGICQHRAYVKAERIETIISAGFRGYLETLWTGIGDRSESTPGPALEPLQEALEVARRRYDAVRRPEMADAAGDDWPEMVRAARADVDTKAEALGHAQAQAGEILITPAERLAAWDDATTEERRSMIAHYFPVIAVEKGSMYLFGTLDEQPDVPRRGRRHEEAPRLYPIDGSKATVRLALPVGRADTGAAAGGASRPNPGH